MEHVLLPLSVGHRNIEHHTQDLFKQGPPGLVTVQTDLPSNVVLLRRMFKQRTRTLSRIVRSSVSLPSLTMAVMSTLRHNVDLTPLERRLLQRRGVYSLPPPPIKKEEGRALIVKWFEECRESGSKPAISSGLQEESQSQVEKAQVDSSVHAETHAELSEAILESAADKKTSSLSYSDSCNEDRYVYSLCQRNCSHVLTFCRSIVPLSSTQHSGNPTPATNLQDFSKCLEGTAKDELTKKSRDDEIAALKAEVETLKASRENERKAFEEQLELERARWQEDLAFQVEQAKTDATEKARQAFNAALGKSRAKFHEDSQARKREQAQKEVEELGKRAEEGFKRPAEQLRSLEDAQKEKSEAAHIVRTLAPKLLKKSVELKNTETARQQLQAKFRAQGKVLGGVLQDLNAAVERLRQEGDAHLHTKRQLANFLSRLETQLERREEAEGTVASLQQAIQTKDLQRQKTISHVVDLRHKLRAREHELRNRQNQLNVQDNQLEMREDELARLRADLDRFPPHSVFARICANARTAMAGYCAVVEEKAALVRYHDDLKATIEHLESLARAKRPARVKEQSRMLLRRNQALQTDLHESRTMDRETVLLGQELARVESLRREQAEEVARLSIDAAFAKGTEHYRGRLEHEAPAATKPTNGPVQAIAIPASEWAADDLNAWPTHLATWLPSAQTAAAVCGTDKAAEDAEARVAILLDDEEWPYARSGENRRLRGLVEERLAWIEENKVDWSRPYVAAAGV